MAGNVRIRVLVLDVEEDLGRGTDVEIPGRMSFNDFLDLAGRIYPRFRARFFPDGSLAPYAKVFLNGRALTGTEAEITPGSEVLFFPAIHGG